MNTLKLMTATATFALNALTIACGTARAEQAPTINVFIAGVDLLDPTEVKKVEKQIRSAAINVCQTPEQSQKGPLIYDRQCFVKARDNALARLQKQVALAADRRNGTTLVMAKPEAQ